MLAASHLSANTINGFGGLASSVGSRRSLKEVSCSYRRPEARIRGLFSYYQPAGALARPLLQRLTGQDLALSDNIIMDGCGRCRETRVKRTRAYPWKNHHPPHASMLTRSPHSEKRTRRGGDRTVSVCKRDFFNSYWFHSKFNSHGQSWKSFPVNMWIDKDRLAWRLHANAMEINRSTMTSTMLAFSRQSIQTKCHLTSNSR